MTEWLLDQLRQVGDIEGQSVFSYTRAISFRGNRCIHAKMHTNCPRIVVFETSLGRMDREKN